MLVKGAAGSLSASVGNNSIPPWSSNVVHSYFLPVSKPAPSAYGHRSRQFCFSSWWRHQMDTFSALLAICAGNSPVTGEFPAQRPVTRSFDVFFDLRLKKQLSKQSLCWWSVTPSSSLWRHCNVYSYSCHNRSIWVIPQINISYVYLIVQKPFH